MEIRSRPECENDRLEFLESQVQKIILTFDSSTDKNSRFNKSHLIPIFVVLRLA